MQNLLAAERRARALLFTCAQQGLHPEFTICDDNDGHALLAAARAAPCLGLNASVRLGCPDRASPTWQLLVHGCRLFAKTLPDCPHVSQAFGVDSQGKKIPLSIPDSNAAWGVPLDRSAPRVVCDDGRPALSCAGCRDVDRVAIEEYRIPGLCLMENAAVGAVTVAVDMMKGQDEKRVLILAGGGNNGGDGLAMARGFAALGIGVEVALLKPAKSFTGDALDNYTLLGASSVPVFERAARPETLSTLFVGKSLIVDGLLGTGFKGLLSAAFFETIKQINAASLPVLSLDLPSGLDADSGEAAQTAVQATRTVTFHMPKPGLRNSSYTGSLFIADIGVCMER